MEGDRGGEGGGGREGEAAGCQGSPRDGGGGVHDKAAFHILSVYLNIADPAGGFPSQMNSLFLHQFIIAHVHAAVCPLGPLKCRLPWTQTHRITLHIINQPPPTPFNQVTVVFFASRRLHNRKEKINLTKG